MAVAAVQRVEAPRGSEVHVAAQQADAPAPRGGQHLRLCARARVARVVEGALPGERALHGSAATHTTSIHTKKHLQLLDQRAPLVLVRRALPVVDQVVQQLGLFFLWERG